jgi:hypothetical protein
VRSLNDYPAYADPIPQEILPEETERRDTLCMTSTAYRENLALFSLRAAAISEGDYLTVAFCDRALDGLVPREVWNVMTPDQRRDSCVSQEKARRKCFRMIAARTDLVLRSLDEPPHEPSPEYGSSEIV